MASSELHWIVSYVCVLKLRLGLRLDADIAPPPPHSLVQGRMADPDRF